MDETERVGYEDWDKIVKVKEDSLKVISANERNLETGRIIEELVLEKALEERDKYPKPEVETMAEEEKQEEPEKEDQ